MVELIIYGVIGGMVVTVALALWRFVRVFE